MEDVLTWAAGLCLALAVLAFFVMTTLEIVAPGWVDGLLFRLFPPRPAKPRDIPFPDRIHK